MKHDPVIIALDFDSARQADQLVKALGDHASFYKVGMELFAAAGMEYVRCLTDRGKRVFLDMKYYDIGETVRRAVAVAATSGATFLTIHAVPQVMRAAVEGRGDSPLQLLAVTVLTSLDDADLIEMGHPQTVSELVEKRVKQARELGIEGIVGSPLEVAAIRKVAGPDAILVTPGVRSPSASKGDQKRVATPAEAVRGGADYIVIGRQVTRAADPEAALAEIRAELKASYPAVELLDHFLASYGYFAIFGLLMLGIVGPFIPDDTILILSGIAVHRGQLQLGTTIAVAYAGSLCGITLSYALGRTGVIYALERYKPIERWVNCHLPEVEKWFERYGKWTLFFGYFIAGVRHFTALAAGISKVRVRTFALYAWPGGLVWVVSFISIGYFLGAEWEQIRQRFNRGALIVATIVAIIGFVAWYVKRRSPGD